MVVTDAKQHEITVARSSFDLVPGSIYCMDKVAWFHSID